jgi:hypothetical protein
MTAINFGAGTVIGRRTDVTNPTPSFLGILQDIEIDFDQTLKELMGQYKLPVDVAPAQLKVTGKAKFAKIQASTMNDLMFGGTLTAAAGADMAIAEAHTPASTTQVVTNGATFSRDLGVFYAATGRQLTRVSVTPTVAGTYEVDETTGTYTFIVADEVPLTFYYSYTVTTLKQVALANQLMGTGPTFELNLREQYTNNAGVTNTIFLKLNACRSSKLTMPFKNMDYTIQGFDFTAFADQSGNWGTIATTE